MTNAPLPLPSHPTLNASRRDWYRTVSIALALITLVGGLVAALNGILGLPDWFSRIGLTLAGLALAAHVTISVTLSHPPRLET